MTLTLSNVAKLTPLIGGIIGAVTVLLILIIAAIASIKFTRRKRSKNREKLKKKEECNKEQLDFESDSTGPDIIQHHTERGKEIIIQARVEIGDLHFKMVKYAILIQF